VGQIGEKKWEDCAFNERSMGLGTKLEYISGNIFGYRGIADCPPGYHGNHFPKWPPNGC